LIGRGETICRGCSGEHLFSALDLGNLPIANELLPTQNSEIQKFPLHLRICSTCGLGQVADVVTPERIFLDYRYLSSMSTTFLKHASDFVQKILVEETFLSSDWVVEIASNDGYLLKNFLGSGIKVIGIEPALNVARVASDAGIETIPRFFSSRLASELVAKHGYPKLIIANNVMAHVPNLRDFIKGLSILCGPKTKISIENPSISNILVGMQFDTIYHEHFSYLSAFSVSNICKEFQLQLFKVEQISTHGGSNRYWIQNLDRNNPVDDSVVELIQSEFREGLFNDSHWKSYSSKVSKMLDDLQEWLNLETKNGKRIFGYGAAAKASTILNSSAVQADLVIAIADISLEKQERFMPPSGIRIISPDELTELNPTDIIIFPWNIKTEIIVSLRRILDEDVNLWCVIPQLQKVSIDEC
jgi:hypothetical protein